MSYSMLFLFLLCVVAVCFSGCSKDVESSDIPNFNVVGVVLDKTTGKPIQGARVADHIYGGNSKQACRESWTGENGKYELLTWYEEHSIVASAEHYEPTIIFLTTKVLDKEDTKEITIHLTKKSD
jgi:5-hydroxyisourate hydrolase-like protein (transthyretin family)